MYFLKENKRVMLIGSSQPINPRTAEVVNLETGTSCSIKSYPFDLNYATGAVIDIHPVICGRQSSSNGCFYYDLEADEWQSFATMTVGRDWHSSSVLPGDTWVITGGDAIVSVGESSEYWDGINFVKGPALPKRFYGHCQVFWYYDIFLSTT